MSYHFRNFLIPFINRICSREDLGRSAADNVERRGFERMVAEVCLGKVGAVAAREVTRQTVDGSVINPEQRINRAEALRMWTLNGAYLSFEEKSKGSIEPGKLADLIVVSKDFLSCPVDQIKNIEALLTVVNGKVVYRNEAVNLNNNRRAGTD